MKKSEAEKAIRSLATKWFEGAGKPEHPSYLDFRNWVATQGWGYIFEFRSAEGAYDAAERFFDEELKQRWRN